MAKKKEDKTKMVKKPIFKLTTALWKEEDRHKTIEVENDNDKVKYEFVIRAILPNDLITIGKRTAVLRGGLPVSSVDNDTNYFIERQANLEFALVSHPEWFDIVSCPYSELLDYLNEKIWEWSESFKEGLKKNKPDKGVEKE